MSKYTAEQVELAASRLECHAGLGHATRSEWSKMLFDYAALLRERETAKAGVTDEMIECAARAMQRKFDPSSSLEDMTANGKWRRFVDEAKCCLEAVAPMLATTRVPDVMQLPEVLGMHAGNIATLKQYCYAYGWNDCRHAMLAAAPKPEKEG